MIAIDSSVSAALASNNTIAAYLLLRSGTTEMLTLSPTPAEMEVLAKSVAAVMAQSDLTQDVEVALAVQAVGSLSPHADQFPEDSTLLTDSLARVSQASLSTSYDAVGCRSMLQSASELLLSSLSPLESTNLVDATTAIATAFAKSAVQDGPPRQMATPAIVVVVHKRFATGLDSPFVTLAPSAAAAAGGDPISSTRRLLATSAGTLSDTHGVTLVAGNELDQSIETHLVVQLRDPHPAQRPAVVLASTVLGLRCLVAGTSCPSMASATLYDLAMLRSYPCPANSTCSYACVQRDPTTQRWERACTMTAQSSGLRATCRCKGLLRETAVAHFASINSPEGEGIDALMAIAITCLVLSSCAMCGCLGFALYVLYSQGEAEKAAQAARRKDAYEKSWEEPELSAFATPRPHHDPEAPIHSVVLNELHPSSQWGSGSHHQGGYSEDEDEEMDGQGFDTPRDRRPTLPVFSLPPMAEVDEFDSAEKRLNALMEALHADTQGQGGSILKEEKRLDVTRLRHDSQVYRVPIEVARGDASDTDEHHAFREGPGGLETPREDEAFQDCDEELHHGASPDVDMNAEWEAAEARLRALMEQLPID